MLGLYATAARGTEDVVAKELRGLGLAPGKRDAGGVPFEGGLAEGMRACLHLRAAQRVLLPLARFEAHDAQSLYDGVRTVAWEDWLDAKHTIAFGVTTRAAPPLAHGPFLGQRAKDAICDHLRDKTGARPDVDAKDPDVALYLHAAPARVKGAKPGTATITVGLDLAGAGLHARGYRTQAGAAPLRETLAAAIILATGWAPDRPLIDPLCGSGTLVLEAALIACRVAPGLATPHRRFGFERWPRFDATLRARWQALRAEAEAQLGPAPAPLAGSDRDADVIALARSNLGHLPPPVRASVTLTCADARALAPTTPPAAIVANLPYGERLEGSPTGPKDALAIFWRAFGAHLRTLDGHTAFLLGPKAAAHAIGMRPTWTRPLMNGPIPVELRRYELGRGDATRGRPRSSAR